MVEIRVITSMAARETQSGKKKKNQASHSGTAASTRKKKSPAKKKSPTKKKKLLTKKKVTKAKAYPKTSSKSSTAKKSTAKNKSVSQKKTTSSKATNKKTSVKKSPVKRQTVTQTLSDTRATKKKKLSKKTSDDRTKPTEVKASEKPSTGKMPAFVTVLSGDDKFTLLDEVLTRSQFWFSLEQAKFSARLEQDDFKILIKPDFNACELTGSLATDPALVEHLIDELHNRGYTQLVVGDTANNMDIWLENRDVQILADMLGYQFVTPAGRDYDIIDLAEETVAGPFGEGSILQGSEISQYWNDANFVIVFAKNKTDDENAYSLCLENLFSALPLRDKDYHYKYRLGSNEVLAELLQTIRIDFNIIDAYTSNHGNAGSRVARPIETQTIIAGQHLLLTDHVAALKMGLDPNTSQNHEFVLHSLGIPANYHIDGAMTPYSNWINVQPVMLEAVRKRMLWPGLNQILTPWLQTVDEESFPFKDPINEQINRLLSHYSAKADDNPNVFWSLVVVNHLLGFLYQSVQAYQIMYSKDSLYQKEVALNINPDDYSLQDFNDIPAYLEQLQRQTLELKADANGLRWTYHSDGSVLFEFSRTIPVDFDDFINKVDIRKSIQYMNDYIGGVIIPVDTDKQGRVTRQLERNLYLPQPNYLVLYQGLNIDVSKLELIHYDDNQQKMYWRTVKSENNSASYDDGTVSFNRQDNGETEISIFGRQQFTLPLFWQLVNLDNYPALKDILFTHAYTTFFTTTMANFEAVYEGREVRIGKQWHKHAGQTGFEEEITSPSDKMLSLLTSTQDYIQRNMPEKGEFITRLLTSNKPQPDYVDEDGFAHFKPDVKNDSSTVTEQTEGAEIQSLLASGKSLTADFWKDLYQAIKKDSGVYNG